MLASFEETATSPRNQGNLPAERCSPFKPFVTTAVSIGIQSVLYNNDFEQLLLAVDSIARAAELSMSKGDLTKVTLHWGDSSSISCLSPERLDLLRKKCEGLLQIEYDFFNGNLGSARGHNRLARLNEADLFLIQNPDVIVSPRSLETLVACFRVPGVGMAEAKQLPIEHPKDYDPITGETSWATTACAMIPSRLFRELGGFDSESFFLYCDDVDYSWRTRLAGFKVIFQPAAIAFHDKRLSPDGHWIPSSAEQYYSAEAALFMAQKWSRPDLVATYLREFSQSTDSQLRAAAETFKKRRADNTLPTAVDSDHKVGIFANRMYAKHRFAL